MGRALERSTQLGRWGLYGALLPPLLWMTLLYFVPLGVLILYGFWRLESFEIVRELGLSNFQAIATSPTYRSILGRTVLTALVVTVVDGAIALPLAYFITRHGGRYRQLLTLLVILPLWSSYLVRVFAWKIILGYNGVINSLLLATGLLTEPSPAFLYNRFAVTLTFVQVWLPFMVLPVITAFEKLPKNLLEASADLNAPPWVTGRRVILPLVFPGLLAGGITVFALTLGDFITPSLVGGPRDILLGNLIASQFGVSYNWPLGAAFALVVMAIVFGGLALVLRGGAADDL